MINKEKLASMSFLLVALAFLFLPLLRAGYSIITVLALLIGWGVFLSQPRKILYNVWQSRSLLAFLALFVPVLISYIDSLNKPETLGLIFRMLRYSGYLVVGILIAHSKKGEHLLQSAMFWILAFFSLDAMSHWLFEFHIYGKNPLPVHGRVRGVFYPLYNLGFVMATLSPLVFFYLYRKISAGDKFFWIIGPALFLSVCLTVIVGGARAGFITLFVSLFMCMIYLLRPGYVKNRGRFIGITVFFVALTVGIAVQSDAVQERFKRTTTVGIDETFIDRFTSKRPNIWRVNIEQIPNYWVNGIGGLSLDTLYQTYPDDYKIFTYVKHSHLHILEVLLETGIIGLIPYLILCVYLIRRIYTAQAGNDWLMVAFLAMMPINSHAGLYESSWLPMSLIPLSIGLAQAYAADQRNRKEDS